MVPSLVALKTAGAVQTPPGENNYMLYKVLCRLCGDVTRSEAGGTVNDARLAEASLYARRHLGKHLVALAAEIDNFNR